MNKMGRKIRNALVLSLFMMLGYVQAVSAAVLNFNDLNAPSFVNSFDYQGYSFTIAGPAYLWAGNSPNSNGTNNLIARSTATVEIARTDGGLFDFYGFNAALSWYNNNASNTLTVNGTALNLTQSATDFSLGIEDVSLLTFDFSGPGYWTADNFDLEFADPVPVPLPSGVLLALSGFVGLGSLRWLGRRRTSC